MRPVRALYVSRGLICSPSRTFALPGSAEADIGNVDWTLIISTGHWACRPDMVFTWFIWLSSMILYCFIWFHKVLSDLFGVHMIWYGFICLFMMILYNMLIFWFCLKNDVIVFAVFCKNDLLFLTPEYKFSDTKNQCASTRNSGSSFLGPTLKFSIFPWSRDSECPAEIPKSKLHDKNFKSNKTH